MEMFIKKNRGISLIGHVLILYDLYLLTYLLHRAESFLRS
jgi:hypothetical protein